MAVTPLQSMLESSNIPHAPHAASAVMRPRGVLTAQTRAAARNRARAGHHNAAATAMYQRWRMRPTVRMGQQWLTSEKATAAAAAAVRARPLERRLTWFMRLRPYGCE
jgi:hypothetical protein